MTWNVTIVDIDKIGNPGDGCPGFLGVPRPVVAPGFLRPKCTEEHADSEESKTYIDKIVGQFPPSDNDSYTKQRVGEDIDKDVGRKPRTLQSRHQRLCVVAVKEEIGKERCYDKETKVHPKRLAGSVLQSAP